MGIWVGISPLIGAGSLEGFAVGATLSGAVFLAITVPQRVRRRQAAAAGVRGVPVSVSSAETEPADAGLCGVEALGAKNERVAQLHPGGHDDVDRTSPADRDGRPAAYRSRHRLGDPIPGRAAGDGASVGRTRRGGAFPFPLSALRRWVSRDDAQPETPLSDVALPDVVLDDVVLPDVVLPEGAFSGLAFPDGVLADGAFPDGALPDVALPDGVLTDATFPDGTSGSSRRPDARRLPRHAAPAVSFGTRVSGRVTGLFAARALAGGAPS
jgi:hypothetical protein